MRFDVFLRGRRRAVRVVLPLMAVIAAALVVVGVGSAMRPGTNGQIAFARVNPDLGDTQVYVVNPDGNAERLVQGPTDVGEVPKWFPGGAHIATCCDMPGGGSRIINPDDKTFRDIDGQYPGLFNPCGEPSPTERCFSARRSATTEARTASTRSARRMAVDLPRSLEPRRRRRSR